MKNVLFAGLIVAGSILFTVIALAATSWYLPEGSTEGFDLWVLVNNPSSTDATVYYTFYWDGGSQRYPASGTVTVAAGTRSTLHVNAIAAEADYTDLEDKALSTKVVCTNNINIYVERAMYWPVGGSSWEGGHTARGISGTEGALTDIMQPSSFPITIDQPGSYKLVENITVSDTDTNGITISASNVELDLNGFTIAGPGYNSGSSGNGINVSDDTLYNIAIRNGNIRNFRGRGISVHATSGAIENVTLNNLRLDTNGEWGVYLYGTLPALVEDCLFYNNGAGGADAAAVGGLNIFSSTIVRNNAFYYNEGYGIYLYNTAGDGNVIEGNTISNTQDQAGLSTDAGIYVAGVENRIDGNLCIDNTTADINLAGSDNLCVNNAYKLISGTGDDTVTVTNQANSDLDA